MSDNVLQTLQTAIQDVIAPDVRELKVRMAGFEKQSETHDFGNLAWPTSVVCFGPPFGLLRLRVLGSAGA